MKGKNKCRILKEIRKAIAKENNIEYVTTECKYQGECSGTCPKCEAEVRYLEKELEKRRNAGKNVALAGIAASMVLSSGCVFSENGPFAENTMGDMAVSEYSSPEENSSEASSYESLGGSPVSEMVDGEMYYQTTGVIIYPSEDESDFSEESKESDDNSFLENSSDDDSSEDDSSGDNSSENMYISDEKIEIMGEFPAPETDD